MYFCELCEFKTATRKNIEYHHIIPKELKGSDKKFNRVYLCPNHHKMIYVENSNNGIHSIKSKDSIIIKKWFKSTDGTLLLIESNGNEFFLNKKNL